MPPDEYLIEIVLGWRPTTRLLQIHRHSADAKVGGDCFRTAIACLLGAVDPADVPHFVQESVEAGSESGWDDLRRARLWLRAQEGVDLAPVTLDEARRVGVACVATVQSKAGPWAHSVVLLPDGTVHCPSGTVGCYTVDDVEAERDHVLVLAWPFDPAPDELARLQGVDLAGVA